MRVLVTGSRDWKDESTIMLALIDQFRMLNSSPDPSDVIVHGACPTGADAIAERLAPELGLLTDPHPANWKKYGKRAGPVRNGEMVAKGADIVLAFLLPGSRGTKDCISKAYNAELPIIVHYKVVRFNDNTSGNYVMGRAFLNGAPGASRETDTEYLTNPFV